MIIGFITLLMSKFLFVGNVQSIGKKYSSTYPEYLLTSMYLPITIAITITK